MLLLAVFAITILVGVAFYLEVLPLDLLVSRGLSYRPEIWQQSSPVIMNNPWFGHGASFDLIYRLSNKVISYSHTHNAFIGSLLFVGIIGTCILLILIVQSFRYACSSRNYLATSLLAYAVVILFVDGYKLLDSPELEWLYFWFPVALVASNEIKVHKHTPGHPE
jgi:O-antigen ligase